MHSKTIIDSNKGFLLLLGLSIIACQVWSQPITAFAGTGSPGFASGDGGPAKSANIGKPVGIAVDAFGNVYIADSLNQQIRKREKLTDSAVEQANYKLRDLTRDYEQIPELPDSPDRIFAVPAGPPAKLEYRGLPLDLVEDLLASSPEASVPTTSG